MQLRVFGAAIDSVQLSGVGGFASMSGESRGSSSPGRIASGVVARMWVPDTRKASICGHRGSGRGESHLPAPGCEPGLRSQGDEMRYEYLILPQEPAPWQVRMMGAVRAIFQHPGRALMIGLLLLFAATQLNAQQNPAQSEGRAALGRRFAPAIGSSSACVPMRSRGMIAPGRSAVSDVAAQGITRTLERKGLRCGAGSPSSRRSTVS